MPDLIFFALGGYLTVGLLIAAATAMTDPPGRGSAGDWALYGLALLAGSSSARRSLFST